jgi:hypothetical protein
MRKSLRLLATGALLLGSYTAFAQQANIPKLVIAKGTTYVVGLDNTLKVDTLIMQDKSTIRFAPSMQGVLEAKVAMIGNNCSISSKGADGQKGLDVSPGGDGEDGGNLTVVLNLSSLGRLTIDTRGGTGGAGANGKNGKPGTRERTETKIVMGADGQPQTISVLVAGEPGSNGSDATSGGNSGRGGNLLLMYSTPGFIPVFNHTSRNTNSIAIITTAGNRGSAGVPGKGGFQSTDGVVRGRDSFRDSPDGHIELINLNYSSTNISHE